MNRNHQTPHPPPANLVIHGGRVVTPDSQQFATAVAIRGAKIMAVGTDQQIQAYVQDGFTELVDADGLVVSPGFIDVHTHPRGRVSAEVFARQGVTTIALALDGFPIPGRGSDEMDPVSLPISQGSKSTGYGVDVDQWLTAASQDPWPIHQVVYVGAGELRRQVGVPGPYSAATRVQIDEMVELADTALSAGAVGISFGTEYTPGQCFDELLALAKAAARHDVHIASHVRKGGFQDTSTFADSIAEVITVARHASCAAHISHIGSMALGSMPQAIDVIRSARDSGVDCTADCYPYDAWLATAKMPEDWLHRYTIPYHAIEILDGPYAGQPCDAALFLHLRSLPVDTIIAVHTIPWSDIITAFASPFTMVASDGGIAYDNSLSCLTGHPRGAGTYPRFLRKLVREQPLLSLHEAIHRITSLPAMRLSLSTKGKLSPGYDADIVLFDDTTICDTASFGLSTSSSPPIGIHAVYVSGKLTVSHNTYLSGANFGHPLVLPQ